MIDINDIAALLHVEEKLRDHGGKYLHLLQAVRAKLDEHEAMHKAAAQPEPEPEPEAGEEEDEARQASTEARRRL